MKFLMEDRTTDDGCKQVNLSAHFEKTTGQN